MQNKRKDSMLVRVYKYGLRAPTTNQSAIDSQLVAAHNYYNQLIELELLRRQEVRSVLSDSPELEMLYAWYSALKEQPAREVYCIKPVIAAELARVRGEYYANDATRAALSYIDLKYKALLKLARKESGVFWGTYLIQEEAFYKHAKRSKFDPAFRRWRGEGVIGVQLQNGATPQAIWDGTNTLISLTPAYKPLAHPDSKRSQERVYATLRMKIHSGTNRQPVYGTWPCVLHRPLPPESKIMWAKVRREVLAGKDRWSLLFTVRAESFASKRVLGSSGHVAVVPCWQARKGDFAGLRCAYWFASDGARGEIIVPDGVVYAIVKIADLQSIRQTNRNELKNQLLQFMEHKRPLCPAWLQHATADLGEWSKAWQFKELHAKLVERANQSSAPSDTLCIGLKKFLQLWAENEQHLYAWEVNLRDQVTRYRKEELRKQAYALARKYKTVHMPAVNYRLVTQIKATTARALMLRVTAPGTLRQLLETSFAEHKQHAWKPRCQCGKELMAAVDGSHCKGCGKQLETSIETAEAFFDFCMR